MGAYQSVQVGGTDEPSPKASVQVILRIKRALSWSFAGGRCFASQSAPPHMAGRFRGLSLSPVTPVGVSALFGASAPQWASTPSPQFGQSAPLRANHEVVQSTLDRWYATPGTCALCHSSFPRSTKFCGGSLPPLTVRRGCLPFLFPSRH